MSDQHKCIAMIPARIGSTRLKLKNLALVNGKPLIYYAIRAAQDSGMFDNVILNSDHRIFEEIAARYDAEFYQRPPELGSSTTKSDDVVMDFINNYPCDIVAWVNPTSPLQTAEEIHAVVSYFLKNEIDTLITVKDEQVHCILKGQPVNFELEKRFAQTQDLDPVQPFVYSVMMWRAQTFIHKFKEKGYAFFCGKIGYYPVSKLSTVIIKRKEDLMLADYIVRLIEGQDTYQVKYDNIIKTIEAFDE